MKLFAGFFTTLYLLAAIVFGVVHRRHHGAGRHAVPTPERTMTPVRHKIRALVGEAAIREHPVARN